MKQNQGEAFLSHGAHCWELAYIMPGDVQQNTRAACTYFRYPEAIF